MTDAAAVDLLVIGAGVAGLSAGARAVQAGARVLVIDKAPAIGGTSLFAGFFWTGSSMEACQAENPGGDPELARQLVTRIGPAADWLRSLGLEVGQKRPVLRYGLGRKLEMSAVISRLAHEIRTSPLGEIVVRGEATSLLRRDGAVCGAEIVVAGGAPKKVAARAVLLATGGFQNDARLVEQYVQPAGPIAVRSNSVSNGGGLRLAASVGARIGVGDAGFYGHLIPADVAFDEDVFGDLALFFSEHSVLLNSACKRFIDETRGDHYNTMAVARQPRGRALMISDQRVYEDYITRNYVDLSPSIDKFALTRKRNARCAVANSLDELQYLPEEWGYNGDDVLRAVVEFNEQCRSGAPSPGRRYDAAPLDQPPFYIIEVQPAITFPFSGIMIDKAARVQREGGGAIPGLFAAGADIGGLHHQSYLGGISPGVVFGTLAVETMLSGVARS